MTKKKNEMIFFIKHVLSVTIVNDDPSLTIFNLKEKRLEEKGNRPVGREGH